MFFDKQKSQLAAVDDRSITLLYKFEKQLETLFFLEKLLGKLLNLKQLNCIKERQHLLNALDLDKQYVPTCSVDVTNDNGNMTLEFSVRSTPCVLHQEPLFEDEKLVGMKYKLEWKVTEPC